MIMHTISGAAAAQGTSGHRWMGRLAAALKRWWMAYRTWRLEQVAAILAVVSPVRCPNCCDWMVAPVSSEYVQGVEIRHHWECDSCGETSSISIPIPED
jgi:hypothetical protein